MRLQSHPLRLRMLLWICTVLILLVGGAAWYYYEKLFDRMIEQVQKESLQQFRFVEELLSQHKGFADVDELQKWVGTLGSAMGSRLSILDSSGRVIADSELPLDQIPLTPSFENRPEMLQLQHREIGVLLRSSQLTQKEYVFVVKRLKPDQALAGNYLRLAVPGSHIRGFMDDVKGCLLTLVMVSLLGAGVTSFFVVRHGAEGQIQSLANSIRSLSLGNYERRLPVHPEHELSPLVEAINEMADRIQNHVQSLSDQKQQWEAIFNGMEEGVLVLDSRGRIHQFNQALSKLTRRTEAIEGRRPLEVIMNNELQATCDQVLSSLDFDVPLPRRLNITMGDGRNYDVNVVRLLRHHGPVGAIIVFHDVTELRRLERVRQDFVANVSHELRTPLTSIKGYVETLIEDTSLDKTSATAFLQIINNNADHMVKIVEDLLQLARLQARDSSVQRIATDASAALGAAWKACNPMATEKNVRLMSRLPSEGVIIFADPDRLVQVFRNLLENAIRYSPSDTDIMVDSDYSTHNQICTFSVQDDGPGIPRQHQQRIFERFYRVEKDRSSRVGSTGLGLAICRHIIRNHGGNIWVQSPNLGHSRGSTFFFTLERPPDEQSDPIVTDAA